MTDGGGSLHGKETVSDKKRIRKPEPFQKEGSAEDMQAQGCRANGVSACYQEKKQKKSLLFVPDLRIIN